MRKPILIVALIVGIAMFNLLNLTPLLSPLLYTMTPLQRYYATDYLASSWHQDDPAATTNTRLLWKAKTKKGKLELVVATERDVVPLPAGEVIGRYSPEPFGLSDQARAEGWVAVTRGYPHPMNSAQLVAFLRDGVYDGEPLWRFFLQPALGLAVLIVLWFVIRAWRYERWRRNMWNTTRKPQLSFLTWSAEVSDRMTSRLLLRPKAPQLASVIPARRLELPAPVPATAVATSIVSITPESVQKSAEVQPPAATTSTRKLSEVHAVPIPPVTSAKPKPAFVWDESQGID